MMPEDAPASDMPRSMKSSCVHQGAGDLQVAFAKPIFGLDMPAASSPTAYLAQDNG